MTDFKIGFWLAKLENTGRKWIFQQGQVQADALLTFKRNYQVLWQSVPSIIPLSLIDCIIFKYPTPFHTPHLLTIHSDNRLRLFQLESGFLSCTSPATLFNKQITLIQSINRFIFCAYQHGIIVIDGFTMKVIRQKTYKQLEIIKKLSKGERGIKVNTDNYGFWIDKSDFCNQDFEVFNPSKQGKMLQRIKKIKLDFVDQYPEDFSQVKPSFIPTPPPTLLQSHLLSKAYLKSYYTQLKSLLNQKIRCSYLTVIQNQLVYFIGLQKVFLGLNLFRQKFIMRLQESVSYVNVRKGDLIISNQQGNLKIFNINNLNICILYINLPSGIKYPVACLSCLCLMLYSKQVLVIKGSRYSIIGMPNKQKYYMCIEMELGRWGLATKDGVQVWYKGYQRFISYQKYPLPSLALENISSSESALISQLLGNTPALTGFPQIQLLQYFFTYIRSTITAVIERKGIKCYKIRINHNKEQKYENVRFMIEIDCKKALQNLPNEGQISFINFLEPALSQYFPTITSNTPSILSLYLTHSMTIFPSLSLFQNPSKIRSLLFLLVIEYYVVLINRNKKYLQGVDEVVQKIKKGGIQIWQIGKKALQEGSFWVSSATNMLNTYFYGKQFDIDKELFDCLEAHLYSNSPSEPLLIIFSLYRAFQNPQSSHLPILFNRTLTLLKTYPTQPQLVSFFLKVLQGKNCTKYGQELMNQLITIFFNYYVCDEGDQSVKVNQAVKKQRQRTRKKLRTYLIKLMNDLIINNFHQFNNVLKKALTPNPPPFHPLFPSALLEILRHFIKYNKQICQQHLSFYLELLIKCLDPTYPNFRKWVSMAVTKVLFVINSYQQVDFHQPTQKVAVSQKNFIAIYDLRVAVKWRTLDAGGSCIVCISPSGKLLAGYVQDLRMIKVWKIVSNGLWGGILGMQGKQIKNLSVDKCGFSDGKLKWQKQQRHITLISAQKSQNINFPL